MGKQEIKQKETQVSTEQGVGKQLEQTYTALIPQHYYKIFFLST